MKRIFYDAALAEENKPHGGDKFCPATLNGITYTEKSDAGGIRLAICKDNSLPDVTEIGSCQGFKLELFYDVTHKQRCLNLYRAA